jgi:anti-sigma regulatory factor (Ser/Thr protein kinase)
VQFEFSGKAGERNKFAEVFEGYCREHCVPDSVRQAADLALEEHLTNVLSYGFEPGAEIYAVARLNVANGCLLVEVADKGKPFNPLEVPPVDTTTPLEEKPIGGLGIHLMRHFMDELTYAHDGERNILGMTKRFPPA